MEKINSLTSIRFILILFIVNGHFFQVTNADEFWLRFWKQHNIIVGCFFLLSGYMMALVSGARKDTGSINTWMILKKRLMRVYPTYFLTLLVFSPMFIYVELFYQKPLSELLLQIFLVLTMTQSWIPEYGTIWNGPTWFLSSIVLSWMLFPTVNKALKTLKIRNSFLLLVLTFFALLGIRCIYSSLTSWNMAEGMLIENRLPWFNFFRFFPPFNFLEFLMGVLAGHIYLSIKSQGRVIPASLETIFILGFVALLILRPFIAMNDLLTRTILMLPVFIGLIISLSFQRSIFSKLLGMKLFVFCGELSFSIYILHGALGQLFYKKAVVNYLNIPFVSYGLYLLVLFLLAWLMYEYIEKRDYLKKFKNKNSDCLKKNKI